MARIEPLVKAFGDKLTADQSAGSVYDQVGGRIRQMYAKESEALPLLIYNIIPGPPFRTLKKDHLLTEFQVDIYGERSAAMSVIGQIDDDLFDLLNRSEMSITGFGTGKILNVEQGRRIVEERAQRIRSRWRVFATQP